MHIYEALLPYPRIDPVLVHLGPFAIRWYALAYIAGLLLGWWLVLRQIAQKSLWKNPPFNRKAPANAEEIGDLVASVAPIGLFFGRIANFINGELWGRPSDVPWAMIFPNPLAGDVPRHPSQLYEAGLEGILLFAILQLGLRKFRWHEKPGLMIAVFFLGYGLFRSFVELFREPDAPFLGPITMGQMLSAFMLAVAAYFFWYALVKPKAPEKTKEKTEA